MGNQELTPKQSTLMKDVILMAYPAVFESFFVSLAAMVDIYMVSGLGSDAVAAVGLTTQPKMVGLAIFMATNVSVSALVARRRGQKDQKSANTILISAICFCIMASALVSAICVGCANPILRLCGSEAETHEMAVAYFRIIMGGIFFNALSMVINAAQRGSGNTKIAMRTNLVSNTVNVIGNYLLIHGNLGFPALGIRGAAIATVFGTIVACTMSIFSLFKKDNFVSINYIVKERIKPAVSTYISIVKVGYSVFIEQVITRFGFMATALMAADMGTKAMAAHQVGMNCLSLSFSLGEGMQVAAVALIGRSLGEGLPEKAKTYGKLCRRVGLMISIALAIFYLLCGRTIMSAFFDDPEVIAIGIDITRIILVVVLFQVSAVIYMGCLRGAGDTAFTAVASGFSVSFMRPFTAYLFAYIMGFGMNGIWIGILADQLSRCVLGFLRFRQGKWAKIKI